jgi:hypothetical protein
MIALFRRVGPSSSPLTASDETRPEHTSRFTLNILTAAAALANINVATNVTVF